MQIKKEEFPALWQACYDLWMDGGGTNDVTPTFRTAFDAEACEKAERGIKSLSPEQLAQFVEGEEEEQKAITLSNPDLVVADQILMDVLW